MPLLPRLDRIPMPSWITRRRKHSCDDARSIKSSDLTLSIRDVTQFEFTAKDELRAKSRSERTAALSSVLKGRRSLKSSGSFRKVLSAASNPDDVETIPWKLGEVYPIIPGRLHFTCADPRSGKLKSTSSVVVIDSDLPKQYFAFCQDFGPNNLAIVFRFWEFLSARMNSIESSSQQIVFRCSGEPRIRTNAAFLLAAFLMIENKFTPEQAFAPFQAIHPFPFRNFRDATDAPVTFELSILDCLRGLARGMACGWFDANNFDIQAYEHWDTPSNGDMHRICPKFIAFKGPVDNADGSNSELSHGPAQYLGAFRAAGVSAVVRLSEAAAYSARGFTDHGLAHYDLFFEDCTAPPPLVLSAFFRLAEREEGVVAVHCRAGLGRTGTLIAAWLMRRHAFSAREAIAWLRLARPGSVIGPQQHFLVHFETTLRSGPAALQVHPGRRLPTGSLGRGAQDQPPPRSTSSGSTPPGLELDPARGLGPSSSELAEQVARGMEGRAKARFKSLART